VEGVKETTLPPTTYATISKYNHELHKQIINIYFEQPAKLPEYFSWSNESNINESINQSQGSNRVIASQPSNRHSDVTGTGQKCDRDVT